MSDGTALRFTGTSSGIGGDYVRIEESSTLQPASVTAQAWVRSPQSPGLFRYVLAQSANACSEASYAIYTASSGGLYFYVHPTTTNFVLAPGVGPEIWDNEWHHVVGSYDGSTVRMYVDGAEVGTGTAFPGTIGYGLPTHNRFYIGNYEDNGACGGRPFGSFVGDIDDVRIWNRALSAAEVKTLFTAPATVEVPVDIKPTSCPNPLIERNLGVLPVALSGAAGLDLSRCDLSTVKLAGVPHLTCVVQDVATPLSPFVGKVACVDCTTAGPDGRLDILFLFDQQRVFRAWAAGNNRGDCVVARLTGRFSDGTEFVCEDVVRIVKR